VRFSFTDDQRLFAEGLRDLLGKECTAADVRAVWDDGTGHDPRLWNHLAEMGVLSMLVPEGDGGLGGTEVDLVLLLQELGRAGAPGPVIETAAVGAPALGDVASTITTRLDGSPYVAHAHVADVVLTIDGAVRDFGVTPFDGIDGGRRLFTIDGGTTDPVAFDRALAFDRGALASAAYLIGLGERLLEIAAEYARQREQFGKPIGSFQAVKHLMADALLKVEFAKPATYRAAWSVANDDPHRSRDVSMAKALASEAANRAARAAIQVHGAIGYTWECDVQLFAKKAWALGRAWGDATFHRRRVAGAVLGPRP
jgi:alkylation response protein AidB-like acyl-CoA dehydrogenase